MRLIKKGLNLNIEPGRYEYEAGRSSFLLSLTIKQWSFLMAIRLLVEH